MSRYCLNVGIYKYVIYKQECVKATTPAILVRLFQGRKIVLVEMFHWHQQATFDV